VLAAAHGDSAVLYDVTAPDGGRVLYATDSGPIPEATVEGVRGAAFDVALLEETFGDFVDHRTQHLDLATFPEQVRRLRAVGALTDRTDLVAIHLSHHNPPTRELARRLAAWGARLVDDGTLLEGPRTSYETSAIGHHPHDVPRRTIVIGGARSGKSREAERTLAAEESVTYVATGYPAGEDDDWSERVRLHRASRPAHWSTVETLELVPLLESEGEPLLVDCLTLWLTRVMDLHGGWDDAAWASTAEKAVSGEVDALVDAWRRASRRVVAVTNEVGQGVVPDTASGRRFRDVMGRLNAALAAATEDVRWVVAGRVTRL
jgi:adenosylcobinamide kinase/adenosylcobinamide-phosphate guanylyltransferase